MKELERFISDRNNADLTKAENKELEAMYQSSDRGLLNVGTSGTLNNFKPNQTQKVRQSVGITDKTRTSSLGGLGSRGGSGIATAARTHAGSGSMG